MMIIMMLRNIVVTLVVCRCLLLLRAPCSLTGESETLPAQNSNNDDDHDDHDSDDYDDDDHHHGRDHDDHDDHDHDDAYILKARVHGFRKLRISFNGQTNYF